MSKKQKWDKMSELAQALSRAVTLPDIVEVTRRGIVGLLGNEALEVNPVLVDEVMLFRREAAHYYIGSAADFYGRFFKRQPPPPFVYEKNLSSTDESYILEKSKEGAKSLLCFPLWDKERLVWCLEILSREGDSFFDTAINVARCGTQLASLAFAREKQKDKVEIRDKQVEKLFKISQETDIVRLLERVVTETPDLIKGKGCSIFLLPAFLPTSIKLSPRIKELTETQKNMIVVLAASRGLPSEGVGDHYYEFGREIPPADLGITGWVALTGASINVKNITDREELRNVARAKCAEIGIPFVPIEWRAKYNECGLDTVTPRPFLAVSIILPKTSRVIGVLRMDAREPTENFSDNDEKIFRSFAGFLAAKLEDEYWTVTLDAALRSKTTSELAQTLLGGAAVVFAPQAAVCSSEFSIFLPKEDDRDTITLGASTSINKERWGGVAYKKGDTSCTYWVFTTGKSLLIENIQNPEELDIARKRLGENVPLMWSGNPEKCEVPDPGPFMCAPLLSKENEILGAVRVVRASGDHPFSVRDSMWLKAYADRMSSIIQLYLDSREKEFNRNLRRGYKIMNGLTLRGKALEIYKKYRHPSGFGKLIGNSKPMQELYELLAKIGAEAGEYGGAIPVLLQGPSGVGKNLTAEVLHNISPRARGPFMNCSCADMVESLSGSDMFGHKKGAFTGAHQSRKGAFKRADGGTIYLDNIHNARRSEQVKLLRVIEEKKFAPLGGEKDIEVDVWVLAATCVKLKEMVESGQFDEGLYYRLGTLVVDLPLLRERKEDIPVLARYFVECWKKEKRQESLKIELTPEALKLLMENPWTGNVRALDNVIKRALVMRETPDRLDAGEIEKSLERQVQMELSAKTPFPNPEFPNSNCDSRVDEIIRVLEFHTRLEDQARENVRRYLNDNKKITPRKLKELTSKRHPSVAVRYLKLLEKKGCLVREEKGVYRVK